MTGLGKVSPTFEVNPTSMIAVLMKAATPINFA
jgi:hypothetical protein